MQKLLSPSQIWDGFDSYDTPDLASVIKTQTIDGITVEHIYFNGKGAGAVKTRVYALLAYLPQDLSVAAANAATTAFAASVFRPLILIGAPSEPPNLSVALEMAKRGYVCLCPDYMGEPAGTSVREPSAFYTVYTEHAQDLNYHKSGRRLTHVDATAKETAWYEYSANTMYAVTYLLSRLGYPNAADCAPERIVSVMSLSRGDKTALPLLAFDRRVRSGALLFADLWETRQDAPQPPAGEIAQQVKSDSEVSPQLEQADLDGSELFDEHQRWLFGVCAQSYLQHINVPVYAVSVVNGRTVSAQENSAALLRLASSSLSRGLFLARRLNTLNVTVLDYVHRWYRIFSAKKPRLPCPPSVVFCAKDGALMCEIKNNERGDVRLYYARGESGQKPNWVEAAVEPDDEDGNSRARLDIYSLTQPVTAFANIKSGGIVISSEIQSVVPSAAASAAVPPVTLTVLQPSKVLYGGRSGKAEFMPLGDDRRLKLDEAESVYAKEGPFGISGVCGKKFGTFAIGDPRVVIGEESVLSLEVFSQNAQEMEICIKENYGKPQELCYATTVKLHGGQIWQKVAIEPKMLKAHSGHVFDAQRRKSVGFIGFSAREEIILNNIIFT